MSAATHSPIVELRQYTLHPGRRDDLIELFDREFVETQEAVGIQVIGQFRNLDDPDEFVWLRGFNDMSARAQSLAAFYGGPIWKAHRDAANATMIDSDNVLLLRPAHPGSGFSIRNGHRPARGNHAVPHGLVIATIYYFAAPVDSEFIRYFENTMQPELMKAGANILAHFITEDSPNNFPALPVREGECVFVWFAGFPDQDAYKTHLVKLRESKLWNGKIVKVLQKHLQGEPELLRLAPTPRSWLTGTD
jgi:hypothetical protein